MKHAFRSALIVSLLTLAGHGVLFLTQMIIAAYFGATSEMDAYLAASTLPSYLVTIIMGSLGYVFIPVFVEHRSRGTEGRAYDLALSLLNWCSLILGMATLLGIVFARELIHLSAPGLSSKTMDLAVQVAIVTWPTILASGPLYLLSRIYQIGRAHV